MAAKRQSWLFKSEPHVYSYDDLEAEPERTTCWDGIRNYQVRNLLRDEVRVGDRVLFYHSSTKPPGVAGFAEVVRAAYPDPTQFDPSASKYDPKSDPDDPRWLAVDLRALEPVQRFVSLAELRAEPKLVDLALLRRGNRLSIQPVDAAEWRAVERLARAPSRA